MNKKVIKIGIFVLVYVVVTMWMQSMDTFMYESSSKITAIGIRNNDILLVVGIYVVVTIALFIVNKFWKTKD